MTKFDTKEQSNAWKKLMIEAHQMHKISKHKKQRIENRDADVVTADV